MNSPAGLIFLCDVSTAVNVHSRSQLCTLSKTVFSLHWQWMLHRPASETEQDFWFHFIPKVLSQLKLSPVARPGVFLSVIG